VIEACAAELHPPLELEGRAFVLRTVERRVDNGVFEVLNVFAHDRGSDDIRLYPFHPGLPTGTTPRGQWDGRQLLVERTTERGSARTVFKPTTGG
jgi:hypothetical protein